MTHVSLGQLLKVPQPDLMEEPGSLILRDPHPISGTTIPWLRLAREDSQSERAVTRGFAARLPLLLAPELDQCTWAHQRLWDVRFAADLGDNLSGVDLMDLASRMGRTLVTQDTGFLDDHLFPPEWCPGVIVLGESWHENLDEFLVTIVGLLGPFPALYDHVKVHARDDGELAIDAPEGRGRRVRRRFVLDDCGLPLLSALEQMHAGASHEPWSHREGRDFPSVRMVK